MTKCRCQFCDPSKTLPGALEKPDAVRWQPQPPDNTEKLMVVMLGVSVTIAMVLKWMGAI